MAITRSFDKIWLVGHPIERILGCKLLSNRKVLQNYAYHHNTMGQTLKDSARFVCLELMPLWMKARIPTRAEFHIISKILKLNAGLLKLRKNRTRSTDRDCHNQLLFSNKLDLLFYIAHADAESIIRIDEDREFPKKQRADRSGYIGSVDIVLAKREMKSIQRKTKLDHRQAASVSANPQRRTRKTISKV